MTDLVKKVRSPMSRMTAEPRVMSDLDRLFDAFRTDMDRLFWGMPLVQTDSWSPPTDILDDGNAYVLTAEVPGIPKESLEIEVTPDGVRIRAELTEEKTEGTKEEGYLCRERRTQSFSRSFVFAEEIDTEKAEGEVKDGVLRLRLPKKEPREASVRRLKL